MTEEQREAVRELDLHLLLKRARQSWVGNEALCMSIILWCRKSNAAYRMDRATIQRKIQ